jgi:hypothetical protein
MPRAVDGTKRKDRRKKILELAKGYYGAEARTTALQKMQLPRLASTHIAVVKSASGISAGSGLQESAQLCRQRVSTTLSSCMA